MPGGLTLLETQQTLLTFDITLNKNQFTDRIKQMNLKYFPNGKISLFTPLVLVRIILCGIFGLRSNNIGLKSPKGKNFQSLVVPYSFQAVLKY